MYKAFFCLGDYDRLFEYWKGFYLSLWEEYELTELFEKVFREGGWIAFNEEAIKFNEEIWAKDGNQIPWSQAFHYINVGKYDKAVDYLELAYENNNRDSNLPYLSGKSQFDKLKGNQRYLELLMKMNLPVD